MEAGVILLLERWKTTGPWLPRRRSLRNSQLHSLDPIPLDNGQGHGGGCGDAEHERAAQAHDQGRYGRLRKEPTGESPLDFQGRVKQSFGVDGFVNQRSIISDITFLFPSIALVLSTDGTVLSCVMQNLVLGTGLLATQCDSAALGV